MRPTLRQLEYIVAVAEHLSFRRAAEACYVTQPGLSSQIREVERLLGAPLFERDRRRVLVTAIGEEVVSRAREVLSAVDALVDLAKSRTAPLTGPLRMGVIPTVAPYLLPRVLPAVRRAWPDLRLLLREDQTARIVKRLHDGDLDLLLLALPVDTGGAETTVLFEEPFVVAAPAGDPIVAGKRVREADLAGRRVLLLEEGHCLREHALPVCRLAGASGEGEIQATSLSTLVQMVANGLGITLLPELAVAVEVRAGDAVEVRPFAGRPPVRQIGLAWRRTSGRAAEFRELSRLLLPAARSR